MTGVIRRYRLRRAAAVLYLTSLLVTPATAFALFPPVVSQPKTVITSAPTPPPAKVTTTGDPGSPIILTDPSPPPTASTPEPSTLITCVIGLACAGILLRRKAAPVATVG